MEGPSSEDEEGDGVQATGDCESALKQRADFELDGVVETEDMVMVEGIDEERVIVVVLRTELVVVVWSREVVDLDADVIDWLSRRGAV